MPRGMPYANRIWNESWPMAQELRSCSASCLQSAHPADAAVTDVRGNLVRRARMPIRCRVPRRRRERVPVWAERLLALQLPEPDDEAFGEFVSWKYLDAEVPGLLQATSRAGHRLWGGATEVCISRTVENRF
jgi:hypothetical protein